MILDFYTCQPHLFRSYTFGETVIAGLVICSHNYTAQCHCHVLLIWQCVCFRTLKYVKPICAICERLKMTNLTWFWFSLLAGLVLGADHRRDDRLSLSVDNRANLDRYLGGKDI